jgi:hypothetical protein
MLIYLHGPPLYGNKNRAGRVERAPLQGLKQEWTPSSKERLSVSRSNGARTEGLTFEVTTP